MTDDVIAELAYFVHNEVRMPAGLVRTVIEEIERLRDELDTTQELLARCYRIAVGHGPDFDVFDDWEDAISAYERETDGG